MKYIMFEVVSGSSKPPFKRKIPVIFPSNLCHDDVASAFRTCLKKNGSTKVRPVSAGDFDVATGKCFGKSTSLKLAANSDEDSRIIATYDCTHGV